MRQGPSLRAPEALHTPQQQPVFQNMALPQANLTSRRSEYRVDQWMERTLAADMVSTSAGAVWNFLLGVLTRS